LGTYILTLNNISNLSVYRANLVIKVADTVHFYNL